MTKWIYEWYNKVVCSPPKELCITRTLMTVPVSLHLCVHIVRLIRNHDHKHYHFKHTVEEAMEEYTRWAAGQPLRSGVTLEQWHRLA